MFGANPARFMNLFSRVRPSARLRSACTGRVSPAVQIHRAAVASRDQAETPAPAATAAPASLDAVPLDGVVVPGDAAPRTVGSGRLPIHDLQRLGEDRCRPVDVLEPVR